VFTSERGSSFTKPGRRKMAARLGVAAKLGFKAHPHMLRHTCGFQLANQGTDTRTLQAYLGHRNIQHKNVPADSLRGNAGNKGRAPTSAAKLSALRQPAYDVARVRLRRVPHWPRGDEAPPIQRGVGSSTGQLPPLT
jgi:hypothetical protein